MASTDDDAARPPEPEKAERKSWRTGEWPVVKIDLSETLAEAYANVRRRGKQLRRRRIISGIARRRRPGRGVHGRRHLLRQHHPAARTR